MPYIPLDVDIAKCVFKKVECHYCHSPIILITILFIAVTPPLVAVQVWVPMSPEWTAPRVITASVVLLKTSVVLVWLHIIKFSFS